MFSGGKHRKYIYVRARREKYDRKKFIRLEVQYLYEEDISKEKLEEELKELELNFENSKTPGLDEAKIKARHILIEKM